MWKQKAVVAVTLICAVGLLGGGCRKKPQGPGPGVDTGIGSNIGEMGTNGLAERFTPGTPYTAEKFANVQFAYDSAQIEPTEQAKVDTVVNLLKNNATLTAVLEGNCDERGSREYNLSLGERRALAVRAAIVAASIDASRLETKSFGKESPLNPGHDEGAWRENRRVEFKLFYK